jgi:hypothetical protein
LCPISATKDELFPKFPDPAKAGLHAANSWSAPVSQKRPNRLKPVCTPAKAGHRLKPIQTPTKAGLDWFIQIFFFFQNLSSFGDLVL